MHGRYVVEHAAVPLDVLDHQMLLAADEVIDTDMLARFQLPPQNVLNPPACLCLRAQVRGGIRVDLAAGVRSFQYLPAPASILAVGALSGLDAEARQHIALEAAARRFRPPIESFLFLSYLSLHLLHCG